MKPPAKILLSILIVLCVGAIGFGAFWHYSSPESTCLSCHEIRPAGELWGQSSHREAPCEDCHGSSFSNGFHSLRENARRVFYHISDRHNEDIRLNEEQVADMLVRCKRCHEREYAGWLASGHSMSYADVFLNEKHNKEEQLNEDCLRCHGMFFDGRLQDVVAPVSTQGPWRLVNAGLAGRPAIPCLACHQVHLKGNPASKPDYSDPKAIAYRRGFPLQKLNYYDRREKKHFDAELLPQPSILDGQRRVDMSPDSRTRICYQCHAPEAEHQIATGDDRTPKGVHEGLSCIACHAPHSLDTRQSCAGCHPRLSNCGLDVAKMDTTYAKPESSHNVHFVTCAECHVKGVPPRRPRLS
ncbi:MAG TPA: multiheme c-type cytochrome [Acidobacteriota bacterium]|nr:multiheme c-type cytochrome [Acidobacteriota bacterium]